MKIGILSDTHKKIAISQEIINHLVSCGAEFLIHAGDVVKVEILQQLKDSGLKYIAVYGNNDAHLIDYHNQYNLVQEPHYFKLNNLKFKLMHMPFYLAPDADIIIFGHTHVFECNFKHNTLFLNPGEACARNKNLIEFAMLEITDSKYDIIYFNKEIKAKIFKQKKFSFKRNL